MAATGTVVRFDDFRGYGFVEPDHGGEDVFIHVNDLGFDKNLLVPGARVEFDVEDGARGLKASRVRMAEQEPQPAPRLPNPAAAEARPSDADDRDVEDDGDVVSEAAYASEITEIMLAASPSMTAGQIVAVRRELLGSARRHGWID